MRPLLICLLLGLALPASAQIFKYTDAHGNTVFTDQPPEGQAGESIKLQETNSVKLQAPSNPATTATDNSTATSGQPYSVLKLTGAPDDDAMRANNGTFSLGVDVQPPLANGHRLQALLDGKPYGPASSALQVHINNADRGEHSLAVAVISNNQVIQQSDTVTFTVQRVNTQSPALRPPPKPRPKPTP